MPALVGEQVEPISVMHSLNFSAVCLRKYSVRFRSPPAGSRSAACPGAAFNSLERVARWFFFVVGLSALLLLLSETDVVSTGKLNAATYCGRYLAWTSSRETRFIQSGTDSRWTFIEPFIMAVLTRC